MRDDIFGMQACLDAITFEVEYLHGNPFEMRCSQQTVRNILRACMTEDLKKGDGNEA